LRLYKVLIVAHVQESFFGEGGDRVCASVYPLTGIGRALDYRLPDMLCGKVSVGSLVKIPIQNRHESGVVFEIGHEPEIPREKLRLVAGLEQPFPVLTPDLVKLARWMSDYYACSLDAVMETMIPASVRKGMTQRILKHVRLVKELVEADVAALEKRAPNQALVYRFLAAQPDGKAFPKAEMLARLNFSASSVDALVKKGVVEETSDAVDRGAYDDEPGEVEFVAAQEHELNEEQAAAVDSLTASLNEKVFRTHLIHGVTGSGKTEVYLRVLKSALEQGGGAILLVPEVALAPQTVGRLRARLDASGVKAVVWHSHLSDGERYDAWHALASGEARVVVGARSAIFAPIPNLRLVIVDEEHEPAYKQEEIPRYHGRDVAVYRASLNAALCVLVSATPSMESLYNARTGKYRLNRITKRIDDRQLPLMHVVDMKHEVHKGMGGQIFSRLLIEKMQDRFEKKEQTILFLNRRGYNTSMMCPDCGYVATCDHCSISLTHHKAEGVLRCHLCGFETRAPDKCPKCHSPGIKWKGTGTQRIEDIAKQFMPKAKIVRIDADTMQKKNLFRSILSDFRTGKIDVLVGTQMIAKGLDFPNVTLVGLVDADISLHLPDFRANERTFSLLVQVSGRAGRGERAGEVVVQTFLPYSGPINYARAQDFDGFADDELESRKEFNYPPFRHVVHHLFKGRNPDKLQFFAAEWAKQAAVLLGPDVEIRGPAPAPIEKIKDFYRYQLWYFMPNVTRYMPKLLELRKTFQFDKDVEDVIDADAVNLS
jgi:primosomal protein N' (replication factor Y) (superfamily II helicase)